MLSTIRWQAFFHFLKIIALHTTDSPALIVLIILLLMTDTALGWEFPVVLITAASISLIGLKASPALVFFFGSSPCQGNTHAESDEFCPARTVYRE